MWSVVALIAVLPLVQGNGQVSPPLEVTKPTTQLNSYPLWPQPKEFSLGSARLQINGDHFSFEQMQDVKSSLLERGLRRYEALIVGDSPFSPAPSTPLLSTCGVQVLSVLPEDQEAASLDVGNDESYSLRLTSSECLVQAQTVWGALRALETLTQLLVRQDAQGGVFCNHIPASVSDAPRFSHRGVLVDTSRHYLPMALLQRAVDSLVLAKFNVLHWHMVDAQSFPVNTPSAPKMVQGAYSPQLTYSMEDVTSLQAFAADRGVRLLLEVDVPGHTASWGKGYPEVIPANCPEKYPTNVNNQALNPVPDATYELVEQVLTDLQRATGAKYLHLGGDEVVYGCWTADPTIVKYMSDHSLSTTDLFTQFVGRTDDIALKLGATPVHWEDVFILGVKTPPQTIFNVWTNSAQMANVTGAGYRVIAAASDYWYLDHAENTWQVMYGYDPAQGLSAAQVALIIGGETSMWGEMVDRENWFQKVWPTAAAVAERLWSPQEVQDKPQALQRLLAYRCRMESRGFPSTPVQPGFCPTLFV